MVTMKIY